MEVQVLPGLRGHMKEPSQNKMVLCFQKNNKPGVKKFVSTIIKKLTNGKYSHVELWLPSIKKYFSSSGWEGRVRFTDNIEGVESDWDFFEVPKFFSESNVIQRCKSIEGLKYDYKGSKNYYFFR